MRVHVCVCVGGGGLYFTNKPHIALNFNECQIKF